jgi:hypothetical protein
MLSAPEGGIRTDRSPESDGQQVLEMGLLDGPLPLISLKVTCLAIGDGGDEGSGCDLELDRRRNAFALTRVYRVWDSVNDLVSRYA